MKIYLNSYWTEEDGHRGYSYFSTKRDALKSAQGCIKEGYEVETSEIEIRVTKKGVLAALNKYGSHPDNG